MARSIIESLMSVSKGWIVSNLVVACKNVNAGNDVIKAVTDLHNCDISEIGTAVPVVQNYISSEFVKLLSKQVKEQKEQQEKREDAAGFSLQKKKDFLN